MSNLPLNWYVVLKFELGMNTNDKVQITHLHCAMSNNYQFQLSFNAMFENFIYLFHYYYYCVLQ